MSLFLRPDEGNGTGTGTGTGTTPAATSGEVVAEKDFNTELLKIIGYIVTVFGGLVVIYALYLAYLMGTASDAGKRAEAKKRVINAVGIILIIIALVGMLQVMNMQTGTVNTTGYEITMLGSLAGAASTAPLGLKVAEGFKAEDGTDINQLVKDSNFSLVVGVGFEVVRQGDTWMVKKKEGDNPETKKGWEYSDSVTIKCTLPSGDSFTQSFPTK